MSGYGASGFMQGLMQGAEVGDHLANRVASFRAGRRMNALQDRIDNGDFDPKNFGGDSAAAQQALQVATRQAQAPLTNRGLDSEYGSDQYDRLSQLQQTRANQRGGAMMNKGDLAGGMAASGQESAVLGNLPAALQAGQLAGQMRVGQGAIKNDGPGGTPQVDDAALAQGTAANSAQYGDVSGSATWADQAKQRAQASIQGMLGHAMTVLQNPQLGGHEAALPYINSAAQLAGYGTVQYSKSQDKFYLIGQGGNVNATFGPTEMSQFAETIGRDPEKILPTIEQMKAQAYSSQLEGAENDRRAARDTKLGMVRDAAQERERATLYGIMHTGRGKGAKPSGLKIDAASKMPVTDADGNVTGYRFLAQAPNSTQPVVVTMHASNPDDIGNDTPVTVSDLYGQPVDLNGEGGGGGGGAMGLPQATAPSAVPTRPLPGQRVAPPPSMTPQSMQQSQNQMNGLPPPNAFLLR